MSFEARLVGEEEDNDADMFVMLVLMQYLDPEGSL